MTNSTSRNRGYTLTITALLLLLGLGMGLYALGEGEGMDRIDDFGLLAVGLIAALWYLIGTSRSERSLVPLALVLLALAVQVLGVVLEAGDRDALGDNVVGMVLLVPLTLFALFRRTAWVGPQPSGVESQVTSRVSQPE